MARPECVIHIGHTKTGTSSIQNCLGGNRAALVNAGVSYPTTPGKTNHALIPASFTRPEARSAGIHPAFWSGETPEDRIARFKREFPSEMLSLPDSCRTVVLSSEQCIHMLPDTRRILDLKEFLEPYFSGFRIVLYLRRQDQHYASAYTQLLRDGVIEQPDFPKPGSDYSRFYDYARIVSNWSDVFGKEAFVPRLFDRSRLVNGDAIDDFLSLIDAAGVVPHDDTRRASNASADQIGQALLYEVGRAMEASPVSAAPGLDNPVWRHLTDRIDDLRPGRGWQPSAEDARDFVAEYADGNEWIRQTWFPDQDRLFSDDFGDRESSALPSGDAVQAQLSDLVVRLIEANLSERVRHLQDEASTQSRNGNRDAALQLLETALALNESVPSTRLQLSILLFQLGRRDLAAKHLSVASTKLGEKHKTVQWIRETFDA